MHVEIWSDIACPWCYVGKHRFETALAGFECRDEVRVTWRSFELDPHRLLHLAGLHASQDALKERLLCAYLTEGEVVGDPDVLDRLAVETGLPEDEVREVLSTDRYAAEVRDDERTAAALGISAVPFFAIDRSLGASGAQPPAAVGELLRRATPQPAVAGGESCGMDGC